MVHLSEVAPPRSVSGTVEVDGAVEPSGASSTYIRNTMTQEQLNDFILSCSRGVGSLVHQIEEETEKLPDSIHPEVKS